MANSHLLNEVLERVHAAGAFRKWTRTEDNPYRLHEETKTQVSAALHEAIDVLVEAEQQVKQGATPKAVVEAARIRVEELLARI